MRMSLLHCISQLEPQSLGPPLPVTYRHSAGLVSQMCSDKCLLIALVLSWVIQAQLLRLRPPSWPGLSLSGPTINVRNHPQQQIHLAESRLLIPVALGSCPGGQCLGWTPPPPPGHSCANKSPGVLVKWRFLICHSRRCWNFVFLNITVCVCVCVCVYICIQKNIHFVFLNMNITQVIYASWHEMESWSICSMMHVCVREL